MLKIRAREHRRSPFIDWPRTFAAPRFSLERAVLHLIDAGREGEILIGVFVIRIFAVSTVDALKISLIVQRRVGARRDAHTKPPSASSADVRVV